MNKKKVFLAHLPQWNIEQPPLGIAYLASYIKKYGYQTILRDLSIEFYSMLPSEKKYFLDSTFHLNWLNENDYMKKLYPEIEFAIKEWANDMACNDAGVIGFSVLSTNWIPTLQVAKRIKEIAPEKIIVIGGPQVTRYCAGKDIINNGFIDFVVPGEGEEVFKELLDALNGQQRIDRVKGILYKRDGQIIDTGERPLIENLDDLPPPSLQDYHLYLYKSLIIPILGSRGCIYRCSFCSERTFWKRYRFRTGKNLFSEIKYHCETIGPHYFYIVDSLINGNISELEKFCDFLIESGMNISWGGKASIRKEMTMELLIKMHEAGCVNIDYGIESASKNVLKYMNKLYDPLIASEVLKKTYDAGIEVGIFWIIGFPTESDSDFQESINFLRDHVKYIDHVTPGYGCGIQPGSELYNNPQKYGIYWKDGDWFSEYTTPTIRSERIKIFRETCSSLGVAMY